MNKRICAKEGCNNNVPRYYTTEDGKKHNCQRRKFCFECSPFGFHNTSQKNRKRDGCVCPKCGRPSLTDTRKCYSCYFNERQVSVSEKVYSLVGYDCWLCGYNKGFKARSVLEFHHMVPKEKLFNLTTREFVGHSWIKVVKELQKCVSLCCRCHREYHAGIIAEDKIKNIYKERWNEIGDIEEVDKKENSNKNVRKCRVCKKALTKLQEVYCSNDCRSFDRRIKERPTKEQLKKDIDSNSFVSIGIKYGVSDNTIRKWAKRYGLV